MSEQEHKVWRVYVTPTKNGLYKAAFGNELIGVWKHPERPAAHPYSQALAELRLRVPAVGHCTRYEQS
jgi:hypothetical protein